MNWQQQILDLSPYMALYDIVVPKDNMLRQINELVDFTFIYTRNWKQNIVWIMDATPSILFACLNIYC
jgi:hypothetical protein